MIFELVLFLKPKLHPPSFTTRSTIHRVMTCLIFVGEVGKWGGNMWLWGAKKLVLWVFYNEKPIWQLRILPLTTLEAADVQLPSTKFSGEVDSGRGNCLSNFFFWDPTENCCPHARLQKTYCPCILEGHLSTNPIECTSPSRSKIQYISSRPLSK